MVFWLGLWFHNQRGAGAVLPPEAVLPKDGRGHPQPLQALQDAAVKLGADNAVRHHEVQGIHCHHDRPIAWTRSVSDAALPPSGSVQASLSGFSVQRFNTNSVEGEA